MLKKELKLAGFKFSLAVNRVHPRSVKCDSLFESLKDVKLNFGPGPNWEKPNETWYTIDIDPKIGDVVVDFQEFSRLPFKTNTVDCVYGSHVFEHMSIFKTPVIFNEIYRVLKPAGVFRLILPDVEKSIQEYVKKNDKFELFQRRRERAKRLLKKDYTLFECLKEDFLSPTGQENFFGVNSLAHQNAWDFTTIKSDLIVAGFSNDKIFKSEFQNSQSDWFNFEGTYPSEANEDYRSLYVEAVKS